MDSSLIFGTNKIMCKILNNLPFRRQLNFRLISKRWNDAILAHPIFSRSCVISIQENVDEILPFFYQSKISSQPWRNFKFNCRNLSNGTEVQVCFWQSQGPQIKSLNFQNHNLGPVTFLEILLACPNLEELSFNCHQIYKYDPDRDGYPEFFSGASKSDPIPVAFQKLIPHLGMMKESGVLGKLQILSITQSNSLPPGIFRDFLQWGTCLSCLNLSDSNGHYPEPKWDVRNVIQLAEARGKYLTRLELSGSHILSEHISALAKIKNLRLRAVRFKYAQVTEKSLAQFFRNQKYLEEIDLSFTQVSEKAFTRPTCTFQYLKKLNLAGFTSALEYLSFLSRMPNLEFVNLSSIRSNSMTWDTLCSGFLPAKLRKLKCLDLSHNLTLGSIHKKSLFNNLTVCCSKSVTCLNLSANVSITDQFLQIIWRTMSALRVLFLEYLATVTNEGFTGIRQAQIQVAESGGKLDTVDAVLLRSQNQNASYIGCCPNIQNLSLAYGSRLTDSVVQFGIKNLPKLQKLKLAGCRQISDNAMFYLAAGCVHLTFLDLNETNVTPAFTNWVKTALPELKRILISDDDPVMLQESQSNKNYSSSVTSSAWDEDGVSKLNFEEAENIVDAETAE